MPTPENPGSSPAQAVEQTELDFGRLPVRSAQERGSAADAENSDQPVSNPVLNKPQSLAELQRLHQLPLNLAKLHDSQDQAAIAHQLISSRVNTLLFGEPNSGKGVVASILAVERMIRGENIVWIAPTRAAASYRVRELREKAELGTEFVRDATSKTPPARRQSYYNSDAPQIIVTTAAQYLTDKEKGLIPGESSFELKILEQAEQARGDSAEARVMESARDEQSELLLISDSPARSHSDLHQKMQKAGCSKLVFLNAPAREVEAEPVVLRTPALTEAAANELVSAMSEMLEYLNTGLSQAGASKLGLDAVRLGRGKEGPVLPPREALETLREKIDQKHSAAERTGAGSKNPFNTPRSHIAAAISIHNLHSELINNGPQAFLDTVTRGLIACLPNSNSGNVVAKRYQRAALLRDGTVQALSLLAEGNSMEKVLPDGHREMNRELLGASLRHFYGAPGNLENPNTQKVRTVLREGLLRAAEETAIEFAEGRIQNSPKDLVIKEEVARLLRADPDAQVIVVTARHSRAQHLANLINNTIVSNSPLAEHARPNSSKSLENFASGKTRVLVGCHSLEGAAHPAQLLIVDSPTSEPERIAAREALVMGSGRMLQLSIEGSNEDIQLRRAEKKTAQADATMQQGDLFYSG